MLTHIFVAFQTISYSKEFDSYYVDFSDPWGDLNKCQGVAADGCHAYNGPDISYESPDCMDVDVEYCSAGVVAVAPYFGYVKNGGGCPAKDSCVNSGGIPGLRSIPCYTTLDGASRLPRHDGKPKLCGQFQFLLRQVKAMNPDIRIVLSIGGWYDSPH
ncbi:hypothetical protein BJ742DRAFT_361674 [Cladochytrium replicatum]|nr:hypothetical protein BJ742DRAFT_361674 [Cladochytrium replicatum]